MGAVGDAARPVSPGEPHQELPLITYVVAYIATAVVFLGLDALWLGVVAQTAYRRWIGHLMADDINMMAAFWFYLAYVIGLLIFAVAPAFRDGAWTTAMIYGALFGFFAYGTYEMSNFATLRDWPIRMVVVDLAWGTILSAVAAVAGYGITRYLV